MQYFGRSQKEQFDEYTGELAKIERRVFLKHYKEMVSLLELAEDADPYDYTRHGGSSDEPNSIRNVQKKIKKLTRKLDADFRQRITEHFMKDKRSKGGG